MRPTREREAATGGGPPTKRDLRAARRKFLCDVIGPGLRVLFVGINPGLYTTAIGHHFGRPGNRFWPALHKSGFTDRRFAPGEDASLLALGLGITNLVARTTANASELSREELAKGATRLRAKVRLHRPGIVAFLGMDAYRTGFGAKKALLGQQPQPLEGADLWVLPNPSGLNAHYQLPDFARLFTDLREHAEKVPGV